MKTVLIPGSSSGYGLETAHHCHAQGWNVIATTRTPRENVLPQSERLRNVAIYAASRINQGRKSLPIMPGCSMEPGAVRRGSGDFAVRGSSCEPALSSPRH
jgi:NAD(P)-dependent dehydrogenase (short-subunit alcohol dehydrogenase family)